MYFRAWHATTFSTLPPIVDWDIDKKHFHISTFSNATKGIRRRRLKHIKLTPFTRQRTVLYFHCSHAQVIPFDYAFWSVLFYLSLVTYLDMRLNFSEHFQTSTCTWNVAVKKLDCLQSTFFLKIRVVLDLIQRDCKPRCYYIGIETRREKKRFIVPSFLAAFGLRRSRAYVLRAVILQRKIRDCSQSMKKPPKKIVSNYLNDTFLMPTPANILPVTVLSQESVFYPIPQSCSDHWNQTLSISFFLPGEPKINQSKLTYHFSLVTWRHGL